MRLVCNARGFQGKNENVFNEYSEITKKLIASYEKQIEELQLENTDQWKGIDPDKRPYYPINSKQ